ncbi:hypothetical protein GCM10023088_32480 [Actinomadura verrucosospora]|uniref:hypothetical protein n=1 Tax=Actinomadura sp. NPDC048021 TaxID=3155385 RepID=UPI003382E9E5
MTSVKPKNLAIVLGLLAVVVAIAAAIGITLTSSGTEHDDGRPGRTTANPTQPQYDEYFAWASEGSKFGLLHFKAYRGVGKQVTGDYTQVTWSGSGTKLPEDPKPFTGYGTGSGFVFSGLRDTGGDIEVTVSNDHLQLADTLTGVALHEWTRITSPKEFWDKVAEYDLKYTDCRTQGVNACEHVGG